VYEIDQIVIFLFKIHIFTGGYTLVIPVFGRLRQGDYKFKSSLVYILRLLSKKMKQAKNEVHIFPTRIEKS
jgi:hypothetical protein